MCIYIFLFTFTFAFYYYSIIDSICHLQCPRPCGLFFAWGTIFLLNEVEVDVMLLGKAVMRIGNITQLYAFFNKNSMYFIRESMQCQSNRFSDGNILDPPTPNTLHHDRLCSPAQRCAVASMSKECFNYDSEMTHGGILIGHFNGILFPVTYFFLMMFFTLSSKAFTSNSNSWQCI